MKEKVSQLFKDKVFLVLLVLGLLTIVAAAGVITIQRGNGGGQSPYLEVPDENGVIAEETIPQEQPVEIAGASDAQQNMEEDTQVVDSGKAQAKQETESTLAETKAEKEASAALVLNFGDTTKLAWPVKGNVLMEYSMDSTTYFNTLEQFKCNPGIVIQGSVSTPVMAPANAKVEAIGSNEELGNYIVLNMGNDYTAVCGQLKELQVVENEYIRKGEVLGYVAEPTKYYSVEGPNIFFELKNKDQSIDPLDYME